jgi:hypothetical protein
MKLVNALRFRALALTAFGLLSLTAACAAQSEEDADESEGALSPEVCAPRAQKVKEKVYSECANGSFDYTKCTQPARDALAESDKAYYAELDAAKKRAQAAGDTWSTIANDCIASLPADCAELLKSDEYEAAKFKNGKGNQAICDQERRARTTECTAKALAESREDSATQYQNDPKLKAANDDWWSKWQALNRARVSCGTQKALDATKDTVWCGLKATRAYNIAFGDCRKECPEETNEACTPKEYSDKGWQVLCGAMKKQEAGGWVRAKTCEDNLKCERTWVCDKFDQAVASAPNQPACADGKTRVLHVDVAWNGKATVAKDVTTDCVAPK